MPQVDAFVRLNATKKGKTHILEWKLGLENSEPPVSLEWYRVGTDTPPLAPEMMFSYLFLWSLKGAGPVFLHHQEWDLERDDLAGGVWRRPEADIQKLAAHFPTRRIEWELTGRIVAGRGLLALRAWWEPNPVLLAAPRTWTDLYYALAAASGRDAAAKSAWFYPVAAATTVDEMSHHIRDRGEAGAPPWPLPKGCALLVFAEHGQDQGYRTALQFVCKNAGIRDRVLYMGTKFNAFLAELAGHPEQDLHSLILEWANQTHLPPGPVQEPSPAERDPIQSQQNHGQP